MGIVDTQKWIDWWDEDRQMYAGWEPLEKELNDVVDYFRSPSKAYLERLETVPHSTLWSTARWRQKVLSELVKLSRKERSEIMELISFSYTPGQLATGSNSERSRIEKKL